MKADTTGAEPEAKPVLTAVSRRPVRVAVATPLWRGPGHSPGLEGFLARHPTGSKGPWPVQTPICARRPSAVHRRRCHKKAPAAPALSLTVTQPSRKRGPGQRAF